MADTQVKIRTFSWSQMVKEAEPFREPRPVYDFSNGRKFYEKGNAPPRNLNPATNE